MQVKKQSTIQQRRDSGEVISLIVLTPNPTNKLIVSVNTKNY